MWGWRGHKGIPKKVAGWRRCLAGPDAFSAQMKPTCRPQPSRREWGHKQPSPLFSHSPRGGLDPPLAKLYQKSKAKRALDASRGTEQVDEGGKRTQRSQQVMSSLLAVSLPLQKSVLPPRRGNRPGNSLQGCGRCCISKKMSSSA